MLPLVFNLNHIIADIGKPHPTVYMYHKGILEGNLVSSRYFFKAHPEVDPVFMLSLVLPQTLLLQKRDGYGVYFDHKKTLNIIKAVFNKEVKESVNIHALKDDYKLIYLIGRADVDADIFRNTMSIVQALCSITLSGEKSLETIPEELFLSGRIEFKMYRAFDFKNTTSSSLSELFIHAFDYSFLSSSTRRAVIRHKNVSMYAFFKKHTLFITDSTFDRNLIGHLMRNTRRMRPKRELAMSDFKIPFMLVLKRDLIGHLDIIQDIFLEKHSIVRDENKKHFELWVDENYISSITSKQLKKSIGEYLQNMKNVGIELKNVEDISYKFSEDLVKPLEMTPFTPFQHFIEQNETEKLEFLMDLQKRFLNR